MKWLIGKCAVKFTVFLLLIYFKYAYFDER